MAFQDVAFFADESPEVITSTLRETTAATAPSTIFIVTGDEIRRWGIRRLTDLVERLVPGAFVHQDLDDVVFSFRGVASDTNTKTLLLFNGHYLQMQHNVGPSTEGELGLLEDIKAVEVINGPGSALYGSGATIAVINIITESGKDAEAQGVKGLLRYGEGNTRQFELTSGTKKPDEDLDYYFSMGGLRSDGFDVRHNPNSGFPLNVDRFPDNTRFFADVNYKDFELMARYASASKTFYQWKPLTDTNPRTWTNYDTSFVDLRQDLHAAQDLKVTLNANLDSAQVGRHDYVLGSTLRAVGETRAGFKATGFYGGLDKHDLVAGLEYRRDSFGGDLAGNDFNFTTAVTTNGVTGQPVDPYARRVVTPYRRDVMNGFLQDNVTFSPAAALLLGLRYDYIEVPAGVEPDAFTPRAALVLTPGDRSVVKVMYTTGFRQGWAAFLSPDQFAMGGAFGGRLTAPEKMRSYEVDGSYQLSRALKLALNLFHNTLLNVHGISSNVAFSTGELDFVGFEVIADFRPSARTRGWIAHQHVRLGDTVEDPFQLHTTPDKRHIATYPEDVTKVLVDLQPFSAVSFHAGGNLVWRTYTLAKVIGAVDDSATRRIGFYPMITAGATVNLSRRSQVSLNGYNLANYGGPVGFSFSGTAGNIAPRSFELTYRFKF